MLRVKMCRYCLAVVIAITSVCLAINSDEQTVIKIDGVNVKHLVFREENSSQSSLPMPHAHFTKWTPWSKCRSCRQQRSMQRLFSNATWRMAEEFEERPCRQGICLRLWHKRRARRRMRIVKVPNTAALNMKSMKIYDSNSNKSRKKTRIWSKWSEWTKCSKTCRTERYKVCKKPGRCLKMKKYDSAFCYYPNTLCERSVLHHLGQYNAPYSRSQSQPHRAEVVATTGRPMAHVPTPAAQNGRPLQHGVSTSRVPRYKQQCGRPLRKHSLLKIKGGRDASRGMWPWHVAVINQHDETFCSGTLIAPRWVLTAAHCVRTKLKVRLNEFDLWAPDGEIEVPIMMAIPHYRFNVRNIDNDIGLLYMARAVKTPAACLPTMDEPHMEIAHRCTVLGWGATDATDTSGYHILQEAKVPIVRWGKCQNAYADYYLTQNMFCAGYPNGKIDTCAGDSGGGLLCRTWRTNQHKRNRKTGGYVIQGITSFGDSCGKPHRYGIYTNVTNYLPWIQETMAHAARAERHYHTYRRFNPDLDYSW